MSECREGEFDWPWCFGHNAPMFGTPDGFRCPRHGQPITHGTAEGCEAMTIRFRYLGTPFDLSQHPALTGVQE